MPSGPGDDTIGVQDGNLRMVLADHAVQAGNVTLAMRFRGDSPQGEVLLFRAILNTTAGAVPLDLNIIGLPRGQVVTQNLTGRAPSPPTASWTKLTVTYQQQASGAFFDLPLDLAGRGLPSHVA
jgi:hypothetical protein